MRHSTFTLSRAAFAAGALLVGLLAGCHGAAAKPAAAGAGSEAGGAGAGGAGAGGAGPVAGGEEFRSGAYAGYNLILVSFDACRARSMSLYGYGNPTTPNLDALAKNSVVFERAISPASWTVPGTMAVFTGLWPSVHGVVNKYTIVAPQKMVLSKLNPAIPTLPEVLKARGYRLAAFTGDAGVSGKFGYARGYEQYLDKVKFGGFDQSIPAAVEWLKANHGEKFFMFLHGYDAHGQYDPPGGYRRAFVKNYAGPLRGGKEEQGRLREEGLDNKGSLPGADEPVLPNVTPQDFAFHEALYDEKIQDADRRFGEFLKTLDDLDLRKKTIIAVFADHGEEFGEHGYFDHGPTLYDEMIHVPLLISLPGGTGRRVASQVRSFDALPTVLDLMGEKVPFMTHAVSLLPAMNGRPQPLEAFSETDYRLVTHKRAVCDAAGRHKFILTLESGKKELYDLKSDPSEKTNLAATETRIAYEMEQRLLAWMASMDQNPANYRDRGESVIMEY
ncbi:MAG: sulfatase-like hydrolase/transferase [Planctomycetes bacterium]|nr:sulfatase-like hydrolase/transferase [Planctomycetota bacterium]